VHTEADILRHQRCDWQPLFDLIPEMEQTTKFAKYIESIELEDGTRQFPAWINGDLINHFINLAYKICYIRFDWPNWKEGPEMYHDEQFDYDTVDLFTKCKLISALIRADRFSEGTLMEAFEDGTMTNILKSIEREVK
jgi:hypothetical protein